jgi:hypothetical protein
MSMDVSALDSSNWHSDDPARRVAGASACCTVFLLRDQAGSSSLPGILDLGSSLGYLQLPVHGRCSRCKVQPLHISIILNLWLKDLRNETPWFH